MNTQTPATKTPRKAAMTGLAVIGFISLVAAGMWLAVYSARYVPSVVGGVGAAAVSLGSIFVPAPAPGLAVVPSDASTTLPFPGDSSTTHATTTPAATAPSKPAPAPKPAPTTPGPETNTAYGNTPAAATPHGLPDLAVTIDGVGYATATGVEGFNATSTISKNQTGAVKFTIKNIGTNVSGAWDFSASVPTDPYTVRTFPAQTSLNPGDSIVFVLDFKVLTPGTQTVSITVDPDHAVAESNESNNSATAPITILGT